MLKIKPGLTGCRIFGIQNEVILGLMVVNDIFERVGIDLILTCVTDSKHSGTSLHYVGHAVDIGLPPADKRDVVIQRMRENLGDDFDVILEENHIHMEYQPKRGVNLNA